MGKHPADIKTLRTAASPHEMRPVSRKGWVTTLSPEKKQAAHISRVLQPVATRCPEFVVWTTPLARGCRDTEPEHQPSERVTSCGNDGGCAAGLGPGAGGHRRLSTYDAGVTPAALPPAPGHRVPANGSPRPARARHVTFIRHTITILRVPLTRTWEMAPSDWYQGPAGE